MTDEERKKAFDAARKVIERRVRKAWNGGQAMKDERAEDAYTYLKGATKILLSADLIIREAETLLLQIREDYLPKHCLCGEVRYRLRELSCIVNEIADDIAKMEGEDEP